MGEDEINVFIQELISEEEPVHKFSIEKFQKDFYNLLRLFWNSERNFQINEKIEQQLLKNENKVEQYIFSEDDKSPIKPEKILQLVKKDFELDDSEGDFNDKEKIILKLFYISYTCNELISMLCGKINEEGFKYKSIFNFYYIVSKIYNNSINGFLSIKKEIEKNKQNKKLYDSFIKGGAAPNLEED